MKHPSAIILSFLIVFVFCSPQFAHAGKTPASIKPLVLQASLRSAGIASELITSSDTEFTHSLYIPNLKGSTVTIGFPAPGLLQGKEFTLEIDGMMALATFTRDKRLAVAAGDSRIESVEAFGMVSCILTSVFGMVEGILENTFTLHILGIIQAVFTGVINILRCV